MRKKAAKLKQKTNFIFIIVTTAPRFRIYMCGLLIPIHTFRQAKSGNGSKPF